MGTDVKELKFANFTEIIPMNVVFAVRENKFGIKAYMMYHICPLLAPSHSISKSFKDSAFTFLSEN